MIVAETATSSTETLTVLHVAVVGECVANDDVDIVAKSISVASRECLFSNSVEGSGALESFLHDKLDSLSGEGLERIVEADPSGVLVSLDEIGGNRLIGGHVTVQIDEILPNGDWIVFYGQSCRREVVLVLSCWY